MRKIAVAVALVAALAACQSAEDGKDIAGNQVKGGDQPSATAEAPSPAATKASGPKSFAMGYVATVNDEDGDKLKVQITSPRNLRGDEYIKPEHGRFLVVTVVFTAIRTAEVNPFDFKLLLANGERLEPTYGGEGAGAQLHDTTLNSGETLRGTITFDAPLTGVTAVAYAPLDQVLGAWKMP